MFNHVESVKVFEACNLIIASDEWLVDRRINSLKLLLSNYANSNEVSLQSWHEVVEVFENFMDWLQVEDVKLYKRIVSTLTA